MRIELDRVAFTYPGSIVGLQPTTASIDGQLIGILGHNGSGKSTLIQLLAGTLVPTSGTLHLDGQLVAARRRISLFPQEVPRFPLAQTPRQTLANSLVLARVTDPGRLEEMARNLLEMVGLTDVADRPVATFSGGMKQKVRIAQALVHNPSVLVLDEPTTGLDVEERLSILRLLHRLQNRMPVVFSTHDGADVAAICDVVAILAQGRLAAVASPEHLTSQVAGLVWEWVISDLNDLPNAGMSITRLHRSTEGVRVRAVGTAPPGGAISVTPTVEDAYVKLTRAMRESR